MDIKGNSAEMFSDSEGRVLLGLARQSIASYFDSRILHDLSGKEFAGLHSPCFQNNCGNFVTLKAAKMLRGCIGTLTAFEPVVDGVRKNAVNAAFNDNRFPPLAQRELDQVQLEISILTVPKKLPPCRGQELLDSLICGIDGVVIKKGPASATFLPQVWQQLPEKEDFLDQLCLKAALSVDSWHTETLEISTYQAQHFSE